MSEQELLDSNESFEYICDYLIREGLVETGPEAEAIYLHMSEEWRDTILN
jgi:hypothetical protein